MSFDLAWKHVRKIEGWLTAIEAERLYEAACSLPKWGTILEIGSFKGRSAILFALSGRDVTCVDPFTGEPRFIQAEEVFKKNTSNYPNITLVKDYSFNFITEQKFDLIYIDGSHSFQSVRTDFFSCRNKAEDGATFLFHDYNHDGVKKAIDSLILEGRIVEAHPIVGSVFSARLK